MQLAEWRDKLAWHFESFSERSGGARSVELIEQSILDRETQCWVVLDVDAKVHACALTYLAEDEASTCIVIACAGEEFERWYEMLLATMHRWSVEAGSTKFEVHARPGWEKFLRRMGMKKTHVVMEMPSVKV